MDPSPSMNKQRSQAPPPPDDGDNLGLELRDFRPPPTSPPPFASNEEAFIVDAPRVDCIPILTDEVVIPVSGEQIPIVTSSYDLAIGGVRLGSISTKRCHFLLIVALFAATIGTTMLAVGAFEESGGHPSDGTLLNSSHVEPPNLAMDPSSYYKALEAILEPATRNDPHIGKFMGSATLWNDPMSPQYLALEWMAFRDHQFLVDQLQDADPIKQRFALATLFYTSSMQWYQQDDSEWLIPGVTECQFHGITCDAQNRVTKVELIRTAMTGGLPLEMGWLTNLQHLSLQDSRLVGAIPEGILQLPALQFLDLAGNHMTGTVSSLPPTLQFLNLDHNRFWGPLPTFPASLQTAKLSRNLWEGSLPPFTPDNDLELFDVFDSHVNGTIPTTIGHLTKLQNLRIARTHLEGELPTEIGLLSSLEEISMGSTQLTGSLPPQLFQLTQLQWLVAIHHQFEGTLSPHFAQLKNLQILNLNDGALRGPLPTAALASLKNLAWLQLAENDFTGSISSDLAAARNLGE